MKQKLFIGRFQPFHEGYQKLIDKELDSGTPVLIAVKDAPPDENNPLTTFQTLEMIARVYQDKPVKIMMIDDVHHTNMNFEDGYGYSVADFQEKMKKGDESWRHYVDPKIQHLLERYLK